MNKKDFLRKLEELIQDMPKEEREDILYDYEEHFSIGMGEGKTEEEIAKSLGDPEVLVKEFINIENSKEESRSSGSSIKDFLLDLLNINTNFEKHEINDRRNYSSSTINDIDIRTTSTKVKLYSNREDDEIKVFLVGKIESNNPSLPTLEIKEENGVLLIDVNRKPITVIGIHRENISLEVYIPSKIKDLAVSSTSGSISGKELNLNKLCAEAKSGSIKLESILCQWGDLNTLSGSIKLSSYLGDIKAEALSGSIKLSELKTDKAYLSTKSGSIRLENVVGELVAQTASGGISIERTELKRGKLSTLSGSIGATEVSGNIIAETKSGSIKMDYLNVNNKNQQIKLNTISGSIKLQLPSDASFNLKTKTVSGRIDSEFPITTTATSSRSLEGVVGNGGTEVVAETVSGSIKINKA